MYVDPWALAVFFIALALVPIGFIAFSVVVCRGVRTEHRRPKDE